MLAQPSSSNPFSIEIGSVTGSHKTRLHIKFFTKQPYWYLRTLVNTSLKCNQSYSIKLQTEFMGICMLLVFKGRKMVQDHSNKQGNTKEN